jgi:hypothetical protein
MNNDSVNSVAIIPGTNGSWTPCPELLTEAEAVRYLRLDTVCIKNPSETLGRYRKEGLLRGTQLSKKLFYRRQELDAFLGRLTEQNLR